MIGEHCLVQFGESNGRSVQWPAVEGAPFAVVHGLHLVREHHVRVQMRVACTGVVVIERGCNHTRDFGLRNRLIASCGTDAGCSEFAFDERNHLRNRRMVRVRNQ